MDIGMLQRLVYHTNLAVVFHAKGGWMGARLCFTNSLRLDGVRGGFESIEGHHATLAAEDGKNEWSVSLHHRA